MAQGRFHRTVLAVQRPQLQILCYGGDFIDAADAANAFDAVYCGSGNDLVEANAEDFVDDDREEAVRF